MTINVEHIASICHEANRAYCEAIGDMSQLSWAHAPQWQRDSAINGVRMHLENPNATPEDSHNSWLEEKRLAGWTWGPEKDPSKKEHPCFLPYDKLPMAQRAKDHVFRAIVRSYSDYLPALT